VRVTASKVSLLSYCAAWAKPDAVHDPRAESETADRGTRFHSAIAEYTRSRTTVPVDADIAADYAAACAWVDDLNVSSENNVLVEVAFAWDPATDTAEIIGHDRDYAKGNGRLCGTADLVLVVRVAGRPIAAVVWDWKTGNSYESPPQLRALSLMVARTFGIEQVTCAALDIGPDGVRELCREDLDAFALSTVAGELADNTAAIPTSEPLAGAHCAELFCPAKLSCPLVGAGLAEVVQVIPADALVRTKPFRLTDPIETAEHAAWAVGVISLMGAKLDAIKSDIKAKVPEGGWALEDGRRLEERFSSVSSVSKEALAGLARKLGATDQDIEDLAVPYQRSQGLRVYGGAAKPRAKRSKEA
jgi:hypothetical protein